MTTDSIGDIAESQHADHSGEDQKRRGKDTLPDPALLHTGVDAPVCTSVFILKKSVQLIQSNLLDMRCRQQCLGIIGELSGILAVGHQRLKRLLLYLIGKNTLRDQRGKEQHRNDRLKGT